MFGLVSYHDAREEEQEKKRPRGKTGSIFREVEWWFGIRSFGGSRIRIWREGKDNDPKGRICGRKRLSPPCCIFEKR